MNKEEEKKQDDALLMRRMGVSYRDIADKLSFADEQAAMAAVVEALDRRIQETVEQAGSLDLDRLDSLLLTLWPRAKQGNQGAIDRIIKILELRRQTLAEIDEASELEKMPSWVPTYLAAWGSTNPDGNRMLVRIAAELAGTQASNVRNLRLRSPQFKRMEWMARHGSMAQAASFVEAGLRGIAPVIFEAFVKLIRSGDPATVRKAMEWLGSVTSKVELEGEAVSVKVIGGIGLDDV